MYNPLHKPVTELADDTIRIVVRFEPLEVSADQTPKYVATVKPMPFGPNCTMAVTSRPGSVTALFFRPARVVDFVVAVVSLPVVVVVAVVPLPVVVVVTPFPAADVVVIPAVVVTVVGRVVVVVVVVVVVGGRVVVVVVVVVVGGGLNSVIMTRSKLKDFKTDEFMKRPFHFGKKETMLEIK